MRRRKRDTTAFGRLQQQANEAHQLSKVARRHRQSLTGDNFYANKLVLLRARAVQAFEDVEKPSTETASDLASLIEIAFSADANSKHRADAVKKLVFKLRTLPRVEGVKAVCGEESDAIVPLGLLQAARRNYMVSLGRQANGCFTYGWYDGCSVMMRRLL